MSRPELPGEEPTPLREIGDVQIQPEDRALLASVAAAVATVQADAPQTSEPEEIPEVEESEEQQAVREAEEEVERCRELLEAAKAEIERINDELHEVQHDLEHEHHHAHEPETAEFKEGFLGIRVMVPNEHIGEAIRDLEAKKAALQQELKQARKGLEKPQEELAQALKALADIRSQQEKERELVDLKAQIDELQSRAARVLDAVRNADVPNLRAEGSDSADQEESAGTDQPSSAAGLTANEQKRLERLQHELEMSQPIDLEELNKLQRLIVAFVRSRVLPIVFGTPGKMETKQDLETAETALVLCAVLVAFPTLAVLSGLLSSGGH